MTIRHMKIFQTLCQNDFNTTKTAKILNMTQPAVSLALKEIEQYYNVSLFDRIGNKLKITEIGKRLYQSSLHILSEFDNLEKALKSWDSEGLVRLGASITIGSCYLPYYAKTFYQLHPNAHLNLNICTTEKLETKLLNNEIDIALVEETPKSSDLVSEIYAEEPLIISFPPNCGYIPGQIISLETLLQQKFLLREPGSAVREYFDRALLSMGYSVSPYVESTSSISLLSGVVNGFGVSIFPYQLVSDFIKAGKVIPVHVENFELTSKFHIIYHKKKYLTSSAKSFIDLIKNYDLDYPAVPTLFNLYS